MEWDSNEKTGIKVVDFAASRQRAAMREDRKSVHRHLTELVAGSRDSAAWLYDTFSTGLFRRLNRRYSHLGLDPDDLLQDAFVFYFQRDAKVLRDFLERIRKEDQTPERLERHLWDLACGVASNRRRAAALRNHSSLDAGAPDAHLEDDTTESVLLVRDQLARMDSCLKDRGRRIYLYYRFRYWDGYSPVEIADITGWSQKATYKLRQALNEAVRCCAEHLGLFVRSKDRETPPGSQGD